MVSTDIDRQARRASATALIPAPAQAIFDVLADPRMHPVIDGGETVRRALDGVPTRLSLGATFSMSVRRVLGYHIANTVMEWDEPHLIARMPTHELWMTHFRDSENNLLALMSEVAPPAAH